jgi:hypothetical protein
MGDRRLDLRMLAAVPVKQAGQMRERNAPRKADADLAGLIEGTPITPASTAISAAIPRLRFLEGTMIPAKATFGSSRSRRTNSAWPGRRWRVAPPKRSAVMADSGLFRPAIRRRKGA